MIYSTHLVECERSDGAMMADDPRREGVSSVEVYGFVGWISTFVAYGRWRTWSFISMNIKRVIDLKVVYCTHCVQ